MTLDAALARMTEAATKKGRTSLVMSSGEWQQLVLKHLPGADVGAFSKEVLRRMGTVSDVEEVRLFFGLAMDIWNRTPQPDRGGASAAESGNVRARARKGLTRRHRLR